MVSIVTKGTLVGMGVLVGSLLSSWTAGSAGFALSQRPGITAHIEGTRLIVETTAPEPDFLVVASSSRSTINGRFEKPGRWSVPRNEVERVTVYKVTPVATCGAICQPCGGLAVCLGPPPPPPIASGQLHTHFIVSGRGQDVPRSRTPQQ